MFAKKMKADIEYNMIEPNVYESTFHLGFAPAMKFPLRFDQPYEHKSPTGDKVVSVAEYRPGFDDIIAKTKVMKSFPTQFIPFSRADMKG